MQIHHCTIQWKCYNHSNPKILKIVKSNEVGTTFKHSETINGNVKNLSKMIEKEDKESHLPIHYPFITN